MWDELSSYGWDELSSTLAATRLRLGTTATGGQSRRQARQARQQLLSETMVRRGHENFFPLVPLGPRALDPGEVEAAFRQHAAELDAEPPPQGCIAMDGKSLRGSFDHFEDRKAAQVLSALAVDSTLVLGHIWICDEDGDKNHEIQAAQQLIEALGLSGRLFTMDALHTQKND